MIKDLIIKSTAAYHFTETNAKCTCRLFRYTNCKFAFACSHPLPRVPQFFFVFQRKYLLQYNFDIIQVIINTYITFV